MCFAFFVWYWYLAKRLTLQLHHNLRRHGFSVIALDENSFPHDLLFSRSCFLVNENHAIVAWFKRG